MSALIVLAVITVIVIAGALMGNGAIEFFPYIVMAEVKPMAILMYAAYILLCFFPVIIEVKEVLTWRRLQSRI
jgi:energy-coupling factor transport system permease protein